VSYAAQDRGDPAAYERYLRGMDASMRQKVAVTAAHLLGQGTVADMGMGSGAGSEAIASLYPALRVVGVDVNPTMARLAREKYGAANLDFVCADIAAHCFRPGSLDGIFDSSVLHHVTTFSGYDHEAAARCLAVQASELADRGVLVVRDFVDPGPGDVLLDLPTTDGDASDDPRTCSTAALFERFAREFRKLHAQPGFAMHPLEADGAAPALREGFRRYRVSHTLAAEFVLRKDYRQDWETEVLEEYTYFTAFRFEQVFGALGLRVLAATPLRNPWIVRHRFQGRFEMHDLDGRPVEHPPTNFVIAGEKVGAGEGVRFSEGAAATPGFLSLHHHRDRRTGGVRDLARRPHPTVDVLPWFALDDEVFVLARKSYPRPILRCHPRGSPAIDGRAADYVTEPLNVLLQDQPLGRTVETALERLAGVPPERIRGFRSGSHYFPSPGGIEEEVRSVFVEIEPVFLERHIQNLSGFSTSGEVRAIEARQLLRAGQVGALPDARLELNVYGLLAALERDAGPWIGEQIVLGETPPPAAASLESLARRAPRRVFEPASAADSPRFLDLLAAEFVEHAADGSVLHRQALDFVVPRRLGLTTVAVAPLRRHAGTIYVGVDDDDLPAAQAFNGNSDLLVAPAWRLPREVATMTAAREWIRERLAREYGAHIGETWELGGRYHPSPGLTPEVVRALAVEVTAETRAERALMWLPLADTARHAHVLQDGHLRTLVLRAAHALGMN
jgi:hypothetical protein